MRPYWSDHSYQTPRYPNRAQHPAHTPRHGRSTVHALDCMNGLPKIPGG